MSVGAGIGIANFNFEDARGFWRWVDLCEQGGIDSIWQSDRIIDRQPNLEVMSVMAALAGATRRIKFGMNAASLGLRDPVLTAKACATIDVLSEGRLLPVFGVGTALSRDYSATGTPTRGRGQRTNEGLQIIQRLWREERVSFSGKYYQLDEATIAPRPIQNPMPLWVGGSAQAAIERSARWGTGWQAGIHTAAETAPIISAIKQRAAELERRIDPDHFGAGFAFRFGNAAEPVVIKFADFMQQRLGKSTADYAAIGGVQEMMRLVNDFHAAGVRKLVLRPIASGAEDMLEQTRLFAERLLPEIDSLNR